MNRLHVVHHGVGGFRPLRALFLVLIGLLMGLGIARHEQCGPLVWPKSYVPLEHHEVPSTGPAAPSAAPGPTGPR
jgi:hypothetical protein